MARANKKIWSVYLLRCADDSLYCGIALDVEKRLEAHNAGRGARYTAGRGPCEVVHREGPLAHGDALRREIAIKAMTRSEKTALVRALRTRSRPRGQPAAAARAEGKSA
ncbi:MAG: GIY-YIG nuclease family protein [Planctomycetota bacterium]|nr:GIY-YIG nuclease family protein [Planctomycetota bacterium]